MFKIEIYRSQRCYLNLFESGITLNVKFELQHSDDQTSKENGQFIRNEGPRIDES
jgi:hypothetical protein